MTSGRVERDRARGALLGTFTGDALGMPFEGDPPGAIPERLEMVEARLGRGSYTDDTQMAIALAESLIACEVSTRSTWLARSWRPLTRAGATDKGTSAVMRLLSEGVPPAEAAARAFEGGGSLGNGAATACGAARD